jgi:hypothetical protein
LNIHLSKLPFLVKPVPINEPTLRKIKLELYFLTSNFTSASYYFKFRDYFSEYVQKIKLVTCAL